MKFEEENGINVVIKYQSGIYFLLREEEVVYVGQSKNCFTRIGSHFSNKEFDKVVLYPCDINKLDYYEDLFIKKYKPEYNKTSNNVINYSISKIKKEIKNHFNIVISEYKIIFILKKINIDIYVDQYSFQQKINQNDFHKLMQFFYINKDLLKEILIKSNNSIKIFSNYIDSHFKKGDFK